MKLAFALMASLLCPSFRSPGAPSQTEPSVEGVLDVPTGPIDPTWVYISRLDWKRHQGRMPLASTDILVLYPTGQSVQIKTTLARYEGKMTFTEDGGIILRTGIWSRTDERIIRIQSRVVFRHGSKVSEDRNTATCALEGSSRTHLASTIHCANLIVGEEKPDLNLSDVQELAHEAFEAASR